MLVHFVYTEGFSVSQLPNAVVSNLAGSSLWTFALKECYQYLFEDLWAFTKAKHGDRCKNSLFNAFFHVDRLHDISHEDKSYGIQAPQKRSFFCNQEAVAIVQDIMDAEAASRKLIHEAYARGSSDNITCIVVRFKNSWEHVEVWMSLSWSCFYQVEDWIVL